MRIIKKSQDDIDNEFNKLIEKIKREMQISDEDIANECNLSLATIRAPRLKNRSVTIDTFTTVAVAYDKIDALLEACYEINEEVGEPTPIPQMKPGRYYTLHQSVNEGGVTTYKIGEATVKLLNGIVIDGKNYSYTIEHNKVISRDINNTSWSGRYWFTSSDHRILKGLYDGVRHYVENSISINEFEGIHTFRCESNTRWSGTFKTIRPGDNKLYEGVIWLVHESEIQEGRPIWIVDDGKICINVSSRY